MAHSMEQLVAGFPQQVLDGINISLQGEPLPEIGQLNSILICGLGGSGIGGTIISELGISRLSVPVVVSKDYDLPVFAGTQTLVIISSYSGNTEETLACFQEALHRKCKVVCISSGGQVIEIAKKHSLSHFLIPGGMPPRACLGFSLVQLVKIFAHLGSMSKNWEQELRTAAALLTNRKAEIIKAAAETAQKLLNKYPVIYSTSHWEGICIRFRQQLNENAKILCSHHVVPEMNHNELVGWRSKNDQMAVVLFRDNQEFYRNEVRIGILKEVVSKYTPHWIELKAEGSSAIEKCLYFIHLGDWISVELAKLRGVDAVEVQVIDHLKKELGKH